MSTEQLKRYAIVRVDKEDEDFKCPICPSITQSCCDCKIVETYGDTKEQLIRKVAQGIIIASKKKQIYIGNPKAFSKAVAKIIVEFLGVEDER